MTPASADKGPHASSRLPGDDLADWAAIGLITLALSLLTWVPLLV